MGFRLASCALCVGVACNGQDPAIGGGSIFGGVGGGPAPPTGTGATGGTTGTPPCSEHARIQVCKAGSRDVAQRARGAIVVGGYWGDQPGAGWGGAGGMGGTGRQQDSTLSVTIQNTACGFLGSRLEGDLVTAFVGSPGNELAVYSGDQPCGMTHLHWEAPGDARGLVSARKTDDMGAHITLQINLAGDECAMLYEREPALYPDLTNTGTFDDYLWLCEEFQRTGTWPEGVIR